ncbi:acyltransferase family protein [Algibacter lectus]|uniref:Peptidoglycan/LPS O-acetylase OafA/YrhL n=1 Tax=Algibacter lectus TaxID=221126 RepID=A0A4R8MF30_9FLAO|nr:acyltransferase [Algibacter lectus]MWW25053.1 acyltransferase family protein [Algibacter lectus]TDY64533.1 peptidoglycan/LPS O-acetylase OafA/YrhL [Algibacter lectus]
MSINAKHRIFGLDVVRATAILLVLCSHSTLLLFPNESHFIITIVQFFGAIGVDLFFVLSGFLIGGIIIKNIDNNKTTPRDFIQFWVRRWFKTLPNYFLVLLLNISVFYLFNKEIIDGIGDFFVFIQNFKTEMPDFFTESWSLSIEEFAYLLVPVLLLAAIHFSKTASKIKLFVLVTLGVIFAVFLARLLFYFDNDITSYKTWSHQVRKVVIYRIDSIYYGFLAAYFFTKGRLLWNRYKTSAFICGLILFFSMHGFIFIFNSEPQTHPLFYTVFYLPFLSISLLLLFPVFSNWEKGLLLKEQITFISLISYALYLLNYSLILLPLQRIFNVETFSSIEKVMILVFYWGVSFFFSYLLYAYFEKPIMTFRNSRFINKYFC